MITYKQFRRRAMGYTDQQLVTRYKDICERLEHLKTLYPDRDRDSYQAAIIRFARTEKMALRDEMRLRELI